MRKPPPVNLPEPLEVTRRKLLLVEDRLIRYRRVLEALQAAEHAERGITELVEEAHAATVRLAQAATTGTDVDVSALVTREELRGIELALAERLPGAKEALRDLRTGLMVALNTERTNRARFRARIRKREGGAE